MVFITPFSSPPAIFRLSFLRYFDRLSLPFDYADIIRCRRFSQRLAAAARLRLPIAGLAAIFRRAFISLIFRRLRLDTPRHYAAAARFFSPLCFAPSLFFAAITGQIAAALLLRRYDATPCWLTLPFGCYFRFRPPR